MAVLRSYQEWNKCIIFSVVLIYRWFSTIPVHKWYIIKSPLKWLCYLKPWKICRECILSVNCENARYQVCLWYVAVVLFNFSRGKKQNCGLDFLLILAHKLFAGSESPFGFVHHHPHTTTHHPHPINEPANKKLLKKTILTLYLFFTWISLRRLTLIPDSRQISIFYIYCTSIKDLSGTDLWLTVMSVFCWSSFWCAFW